VDATYQRALLIGVVPHIDHILSNHWLRDHLYTVDRTAPKCALCDHASHAHQNHNIVTLIRYYAYPMLLQHNYSHFIVVDRKGNRQYLNICWFFFHQLCPRIFQSNILPIKLGCSHPKSIQSFSHHIFNIVFWQRCLLSNTPICIYDLSTIKYRARTHSLMYF